MGRLVAEKGPDVFVEAAAGAMARLPGWRAEMIGADRFGVGARRHSVHPGHCRRGRRPRASRCSATGTHEQVLEAMARAAIVVVPSRWQEPFGLTALEAMACGAALVCSPRGGLPEVGGDAALYAEPDDPAAVADAILALALDPGPARGGRRGGPKPCGAVRSALGSARRLTALRRDLIGMAGNPASAGGGARLWQERDRPRSLLSETEPGRPPCRSPHRSSTWSC